MEYDFRRSESLNFGKGRCIPLQPSVLKGKPANYYDQTRRGLGYTTPSIRFDSESKKYLPSHFSDSSEWEFDISVRVAFKKFFVNITTTSQVEPEDDIEPFDTDPWAQKFDLQWEKHFEQRDPPIEDKVIQIDMGNQVHLKLISISENLSPTET